MDPYEVLRVSKDSSDQEIREAYRKLVKQYHPDINKSEEAKLRIVEVNEAYEVLSDSERRMQLDSVSVFENSLDEDPREAYRRDYINKKKRWRGKQRN